MLLRLFDEVYFAKCPLDDEFLHAYIFRSETEFLGVSQHDSSPPTGLDHSVTLRDVERHGFFHDHVLAGLRGLDRHIVVKMVR